MFKTRLNPTKPPARHRSVLERVGAACRELRPIEDACATEMRVNEQTPRIFARHGVHRVGVSAEFDGAGDDPLLVAMTAERIGREGFAPLDCFAVHAVGSAIVNRWASVEQRAARMAALACGESFVTLDEFFRYTSAESSCEVFYEEAPHGYTLNGRTRCRIVPRTGATLTTIAEERIPNNGGAHSAFQLELERPGIQLLDLPRSGGAAGAAFWNVEIKQCEVPRAALLGDVGCGMDSFRTAPMIVDFCLAAGSLGVMAEVLETWCRLVSERFGTRSREDAELKRVFAHVAQTATKLEAARSLVYAAAELKVDYDRRPSSGHLEREAATLVREAIYFATNAVHEMFTQARAITIAGQTLFDHVPARHRPDRRAPLPLEAGQALLEGQIASYYFSP